MQFWGRNTSIRRQQRSGRLLMTFVSPQEMESICFRLCFLSYKSIICVNNWKRKLMSKIPSTTAVEFVFNKKRRLQILKLDENEKIKQIILDNARRIWIALWGWISSNHSGRFECATIWTDIRKISIAKKNVVRLRLRLYVHRYCFFLI